jgi:hypothetical protein
MERRMSAKTISKLASAAALGATLLGTPTSAMAAPMGIAPKATVAAPSAVTDVQWRRWGGGGYYRRGWGGGWGGPALGAAVGLGVLGAAAAATAAPYYYGYPAYGYPAYYGYPGYYYGYPY